MIPIMRIQKDGAFAPSFLFSEFSSAIRTESSFFILQGFAAERTYSLFLGREPDGRGFNERNVGSFLHNCGCLRIEHGRIFRYRLCFGYFYAVFDQHYARDEMVIGEIACVDQRLSYLFRVLDITEIG